MKKRTQEEKIKMVNEACTLLNEAIVKAREARKLLHLCGVDICSLLDFDECFLTDRDKNVQIFRGIQKLEKIVGFEGYYPSQTVKKGQSSRKTLPFFVGAGHVPPAKGGLTTMFLAWLPTTGRRGRRPLQTQTKVFRQAVKDTILPIWRMKKSRTEAVR